MQLSVNTMQISEYISVIIIIIVITLTRSIYNYISETNKVFNVYSVADILWLQFMVKVKVTLNEP